MWNRPTTFVLCAVDVKAEASAGPCAFRLLTQEGLITPFEAARIGKRIAKRRPMIHAGAEPDLVHSDAVSHAELNAVTDRVR